MVPYSASVLLIGCLIFPSAGCSEAIPSAKPIDPVSDSGESRHAIQRNAKGYDSTEHGTPAQGSD